jgi:hypothetical protein
MAAHGGRSRCVTGCADQARAPHCASLAHALQQPPSLPPPLPAPPQAAAALTAQPALAQQPTRSQLIWSPEPGPRRCYCAKNWYMTEQCRILGEKHTQFPFNCSLGDFIKPRKLVDGLAVQDRNLTIRWAGRGGECCSALLQLLLPLVMAIRMAQGLGEATTGRQRFSKLVARQERRGRRLRLRRRRRRPAAAVPAACCPKPTHTPLTSRPHSPLPLHPNYPTPTLHPPPHPHTRREHTFLDNPRTSAEVKGSVAVVKVRRRHPPRLWRPAPRGPACRRRRRCRMAPGTRRPPGRPLALAAPSPALG